MSDLSLIVFLSIVNIVGWVLIYRSLLKARKSWEAIESIGLENIRKYKNIGKDNNTSKK